MKANRSILGPFITLLLLLTVVALFLRQRVDPIATCWLQDHVDELLAESGFSARIQQVSIIKKVGLEIRGLQIFDNRSDSSRPLFSAESLVARFPIDVDLLRTQCAELQSITVHGPRVFLDAAELTPEFWQRCQVLVHAIPCRNRTIPCNVRDGNATIQWRDARTKTRLYDLTIDIEPSQKNNRIAQFACQLTGDDHTTIEVAGAVDLPSKAWRMEIKTLATQINNETWATIWSELFAVPFDSKLPGRFRANVELAGQLAGRGSECTQFDLRGIASSGLLEANERLPISIRSGSAEFRMDNDGVTINRARGKIGAGRFDVTFQRMGWSDNAPWRSQGTLNNVELVPGLTTCLPDAWRKFEKDFSPRGTFDVRFALDSKGKKDIAARISDMSFSYQRFPYLVEHCVGNVRWIDDRLDIALQSLQQQQLLELTGIINHPGPNATYQIRFGTNGRLPIDDKLLNILRNYPTVSQTVRDFSPTGQVNGWGSVRKASASSTTVHRELRINVHNATVRHRVFPYPIQGITGVIQNSDDQYEFVDVVGSNGNSPIACDGSWNPVQGLRLEFQCNDVPVDGQLRNALAHNLQEIWDGIRPAGKVKFVRVALEHPPGKMVDVRVQAKLADSFASAGGSLSIEPIWFPWLIQDLKGDVSIGGGNFELQKVSGRHGSAWVTCDGEGRYSDLGWSLKLKNLLAAGIKPDLDLLRAFPDQLASAIRRLDYKGQINISGSLGFASQKSNGLAALNHSKADVIQVAMNQPTDRLASDWDLRLDIDQGAMMAGLPLENVFGSVRLLGTSRGTNSECRGDVSIDSLTIHGVQISNIRGPIWIDDNQTLAGKFAPSFGGQNASDSLVGSVFNGTILFDGWVSHADKYPFFVQTVVEKTRLADLAAEVAPRYDLSGEGYGILQIQGNSNELHSYNGKGNFHLQNAKIEQLPIILSLLKILSIKEVNRTAFDSAIVDFSVNGDQLNLERIELIGDAISLIGNGYLELMRYADVNFYSVVGRNRFHIPVLSDLYRAGAQRIMWVNIGGPLNNLQTTRKVLPGLDDSLRSLLNGNSQHTIAPTDKQGREP